MFLNKLTLFCSILASLFSNKNEESMPGNSNSVFNDAKIEKECKKLKIYHKVLSHRPSQFPRDRFTVTVAILAQQLKLRALGIKRERRSLALDFELGK
jgi:hypothetical protein